MRLLHYPPLPDDAPAGAIRAAAHGDINTITLLLGAEEAGLQLLTAKGEWMASVGDGEPGFVDGDAERARFRRPQGVALAGSMLYVADTGNHALRAIDLTTLAVTTLAGNGRLGRSVPQGLTDARRVELRSPWAVELAAGLGFLALAGAPQIGA